MELLPFAEFAINSSVQDSSGLSPQKFVFGSVLRAPVVLVDCIRLRLLNHGFLKSRMW